MSLYDEAKELIPIGNLYSKRPEVHAPDQWPPYYERAKGITVTTPDDHSYRDFSGAGVGACILGFADPAVDAAVTKTVSKGSTGPLLCQEEVELAKVLIHLHPWAQQVRFARSGGEAIAIAIRIARTHTGRINVLYSPNSYHGWHVNNPLDHNVYYTRWESGGEVAAYITEPERLSKTLDLQGIVDEDRNTGGVAIFDEISCGFRFNLGGRHLHYGVNPDIAVFSKAMSNGYPMAAVIGTEKVMSACQDTFISSTTWSERIGPTAALATIQKLWAKDVFKHTAWVGDLVKTTLVNEAKKSGLELEVEGPGQLLHLRFANPECQTLYTQTMLEKGFLAGKDFYASYAHTLEDCEDFARAVKDVFPFVQQAHEKGTVINLLKGPVAESGIKR